jgi:Carbamoyltransferase C-terminus
MCGEPIVCTPEDSYRYFMRTEMDYLVLETCVLDKKEQPVFNDQIDWASLRSRLRRAVDVTVICHSAQSLIRVV